MKTLLICLLCSVSGFTATFSCVSTGTGNLSDVTKWAACNGTYPHNGGGNLYTAQVLNGHVITADVNVTVGTSPSGNSPVAVRIGTTTPAGGASTAQLVIPAGVSLTAQGSIGVIGQQTSATCTVGYWATLVKGTLQFDAALAASPSATHYQYFMDPATSNNAGCDATIKASGTQSSHAAITSNVAGGAGTAFITQNVFLNSNGCDVWFDWVDVTNMGTASTSAIALRGDSYNTNCVLHLHNWTIQSSGSVSFSGVTASQGLDIRNGLCGNMASNVPCFAIAANAGPYTGVRIFDSVSVINPGTDILFSNTTSCAGLSITDSVVTGNSATSPALCDYSNGSLSMFDSSVFLHLATSDIVAIPSPVIAGSYLVNYGDGDNMHMLNNIPPNLGIIGSVFDSTTRLTAYTDTGEIIYPTINSVATSVSGNVFGPGADPLNNMPGIPMAVNGTISALAVVFNSNTSFGSNSTGGQVGAVVVEEGNHTAPVITSLLSNLLVGIGVSPGGWLWHDTQCVYGETGPACTSNLVAPTNADYNGKYNSKLTDTCASCTNQGRGYVGNFSATPGSHDVALGSAPGFTDTTRNLLTFATAYLGQAVCAAWASGQSYTAGQCVSIADAGYYGGPAINYLAIAAHTSSTSNQPGAAYTGNGLHALLVWLPQSLNWIQTALLNGTTITDPAIGCVRCSYPMALVKWSRLGYTPTNTALKGAGKFGLDIGAVPFVAPGWFAQ